MAEIDFAQIDRDGWLEVIPGFQRATISELLAMGRTEEEVAELWLNRIGPETNSGFGAVSTLKTYFSNFRDEIDAFICGDKKYKSERTKAKAVWEKQGKNGLVALIAGFIATNIGLAAVALVPVVSLILEAVGKMGVNAYCKTRGHTASL